MWWVADASNPAEPAVPLRYPAAGTPNADVQLWLVPVDGRPRPGIEVSWDRAAFPYLASVDWSAGLPLTVTVQSRDQRRLAVLAVDPVRA